MLFYFFVAAPYPKHEAPLQLSAEFVEFLAIRLQACYPKAGQAVAINLTLPAKEFLSCNAITCTRIFKTEQPAFNSDYNFSFATRNPTFCVGRR
jgi:hypothetical protein